MRESDLLQHIYAHNTSLPTNITIPPGDDMAAVRIGHTDVLVATDQLVDGVHFDLATTTLQRIGRKAITRNLSDVAAMAALPAGAVAAGSLPRDFSKERADELFDAMRTTAESYKCPLVGGDITIYDGPLHLTVTVFAFSSGMPPVTRAGAQVGDTICVTGNLGGSLEDVDGYIHHLDFEPRIAIARKLASIPDMHVHSMIDLSDGLAKDLGHLMRAANLSCTLDAIRLPISPSAKAASKHGRPEWEHALADGEDYELCFTCASVETNKVDGVPVTAIGTVTEAREHAIEIKHADGTTQPITDLGWEHSAEQ